MKKLTSLMIIFLVKIFFIQFQSCNCAYIFSYILHNPITDDLTARNNNDDKNFRSNSRSIENFNFDHLQSDQHYIEMTKRVQCINDTVCKQLSENSFCDTHYGYCEKLRKRQQLCRFDEQCELNLICLFGKCEHEVKPGEQGARCKTDADCNEHHCCARQHGEKICKRKLQRGQRCFVPLGGLDYSLNELCPCDENLVCLPKRSKSDHRAEKLRSVAENLRCKRISSRQNKN